MEKFVRTMFKVGGIFPIIFGLLIFFNYFFGYDRLFKGQTSPPNPYFAAALLIVGIVWTLWFQKRPR